MKSHQRLACSYKKEVEEERVKAKESAREREGTHVKGEKKDEVFDASANIVLMRRLPIEMYCMNEQVHQHKK